MIPKSVLYKLVRKSDGLILAEGSKKDMERLRKATPGTFVGVTSKTVGQYWN